MTLSTKVTHKQPFPLVGMLMLSLASTILLPMGPARAFAHGDYHELVDELTVKLEQDPTNAELHFKLADANCDHGDGELALQNLKRVAELAPGKFGMDLVRGKALLLIQQPSAAKEAFDRHLALNMSCVDARIYRARAFRKLDQQDAALEDYRDAISMMAVPPVEYLLEFADALAGNDRSHEAYDVICAGIGKIGHDPSLLQRAMELEIASGKIDSALERVAAMEKIAPQRAPWLARRAEILERAGRTAAARSAWMALKEHILTLPNLERGTPQNRDLLGKAEKALGGSLPSLVVAPPSSPVPNQ